MEFHLVDESLDARALIPLSEAVREAVAIQWSRCENDEDVKSLSKRLQAVLEPSVIDALDWDLRPPSPAQKKFAYAICSRFGVGMPAEVLRYQGAMHDFLERYAAAYKTNAPL